MSADAADRRECAPGDKVLDQLAGLIEPLTRFDRSSIIVRQVATEPVAVAARQRFDVQFPIQAASGRGPLPSGVEPVADGAALASRAAAVAQAARIALPARLQGWAASNASRPGATLQPADCFDGPRRVGSSHSCRACGGRGDVACGPCGSQGRVTCPGCGGLRYTNCMSCQNGSVQCSTCGGRGVFREQESRTVWDSASNSNRSEYVWVERPCNACRGGRVACGRCGGHGKVDCRQCVDGRITCPTCNGGGRARCSDCDATGTLHQLSTVSCTVGGSLTVAANTRRDEPRAAIQSAASLDALARWTALEQSDAQVREATLEREFAGSVPVTVLSLEVAGRNLDLYGYGPIEQVQDFKNVVGILLQGDLDALNGALDRSPRVPLRPVAELDRALADFLKSEIHARIAGADAAAESQAGAAAARFGSAVSGDYVSNATAVLRKAIARVYRSEMPGVLAAVLLVTAVAFALFFALPRERMVYALLVPLLAAAATALGLEYRAMRRVRGRLGTAMGPRALEVVRSGARRGWWRAAFAIGTVAVLSAGVALTVAFSPDNRARALMGLEAVRDPATLAPAFQGEWRSTELDRSLRIVGRAGYPVGEWGGGATSETVVLWMGLMQGDVIVDGSFVAPDGTSGPATGELADGRLIVRSGGRTYTFRRP